MSGSNGRGSNGRGRCRVGHGGSWVGPGGGWVRVGCFRSFATCGGFYLGCSRDLDGGGIRMRGGRDFLIVVRGALRRTRWRSLGHARGRGLRRTRFWRAQQECENNQCGCKKERRRPEGSHTTEL